MRKRILIVESEGPVAEALERRLLARGYEPTRASDAAEALERFDGGRHDLVVLSLTLGADAGRSVCRGIRTRPLGALVPILFLGTGREEVRSVSEAIAAGADHYFKKPEGLEDLLAKVVTYIGPGAEAPPPLASDATPLVEAGAPPPGGDFYRTIRDVLATRPTPPPPANWEEVARATVVTPTPAPAAPAGLPEVAAWRPPTIPPATEPEPARRSTPPTPEPPPDAAARPGTAPMPEAWRPGSGTLPEMPTPGLFAAAGRPAFEPAGRAFPPDPGPRPLPEPAGALPSRAFSPQEPAPALPVERAPGRAPAPVDDAELVLAPGQSTDLEQRGLGELLAAASRTGVTGRVEVAAGGVLRRVFLDGGAPVYADSSEATEDLAAFLAGEGRVARAAVSEARARARALETTPEQVLIEAGYVRPDEVHRALRGHVLDRVLALFAIETGEAVFLRGGPRAPDPVDLAVHPGRVVLDGVRRKYGRLRLYRAFGTPGVVPRARRDVGVPPGLMLRPDEEQVLAALDGRRSVLDLARALGLSEIDALAILYGLAVLGAVERPAPGRTVGVLPPLDPEALARATAPRTDDQMPGFPELVAAKYADAQTADYFQVLGVPRHATGAEIRAAWERLRRQFDPHRVRRDSPLWHQVREIAAVLDDAWAVLSGERLRTRYAATLE